MMDECAIAYSAVFNHDKQPATSRTQQHVQPAIGMWTMVAGHDITIPVIMHPSMSKVSSC